jgi:protein TonB
MSFAERLRTAAGRRTLSFGLVVLIEGLLLLMLLSFGIEKPPVKREKEPVVFDLKAETIPEDAPQQSSPEPAKDAEKLPEPPQPATEAPKQPAAPAPSAPAAAAPVTPAPPPLPSPVPAKNPQPSAAAAPRSPAPPAAAARPVYGPPDKGRPAYLKDTERVGTAPNGQPLYAAAWYREPDPKALGAYLSTAQGPGYGLIACRTAPNYRVEDCVGLSEYPQGSQIMRSVLAAAWEFKVRPPRLGGQPMVGSWVRIRIEYGMARR